VNEIPGDVFVRFVSGLVGERAGAKEPADNGYHGGKVEHKIKTLREQCRVTAV